MKLQRLLAIFVFIVINFIACGSNNKSNITDSKSIDLNTISFKKHYQHKDKISIVYPQNWTKKNVYDVPEILAVFTEPQENENDEFLENVLLIKVDSETNVTAEEISNINLITSNKTTVAGFKAQEDIFDADILGAEKYNFRFMQISFNFNGSIYAIFYTAEKKSFERNIEVVRHMAKSLKIGQMIFDGFDLTSDLSQPGKPAIASDGENFLVVSCSIRKDDGKSYEIIGKIIKNDRSMGKEFIIHSNNDYTNEECTYVSCNVIFDGNNYLVTYSGHMQDSLYKNKILGKRVSISGKLLDTTPINISKNINTSAYEPSIAFDGNRSLIVWHEANSQGISDEVILHNILGAFIEKDGSVSNKFVIQDDVKKLYPDSKNTYRYTTQIAYGKDQFMVIWSPYFFSDVRRRNISIYGQQLDSNGKLLLSDSMIIRSDLGDNPRYAQIVFDGTNYFVAWIEGLLETNVISSGRFTVYGRHISSTGELINTNEDELGTIIASHIMTKDVDWKAKEVSKEFLHLSYYNNKYTFLWTSINYISEQAVYVVQATKDLKKISQPLVLSGINKNSDKRLPRPSQANIANTKQHSFAVWPLRDGTIEGWFFNDSYFKYKSLE